MLWTDVKHTKGLDTTAKMKGAEGPTFGGEGKLSASVAVFAATRDRVARAGGSAAKSAAGCFALDLQRAVSFVLS